MEEEMEELYVEGLATHGGPESCVDDPRGRGEALTGVRAGRAIEPRNQEFGVPTLYLWRKATSPGAFSRVAGGPRGGRGDMAGLRAGPGAQSPRPAREGPGGALPGEAESAGAHPEGGRAATAARDRIAGGQDCPAGRRRGAGRRLRGGLPGLLLWVPARA